MQLYSNFCKYTIVIDDANENIFVKFTQTLIIPLGLSQYTFKTAHYAFEQCSKSSLASMLKIMLSGNVKFNRFKLYYEGGILAYTIITLCKSFS